MEWNRSDFCRSLRDAIASENGEVDGEVFRFLLERLLGTRVELWSTRIAQFRGWKSVYKFAPSFLNVAKEGGVQHALFVIDNDGGGKRYPEHSAQDQPLPHNTAVQTLIDTFSNSPWGQACRHLSRGFRAPRPTIHSVHPVPEGIHARIPR